MEVRAQEAKGADELALQILVVGVQFLEDGRLEENGKATGVGALLFGPNYGARHGFGASFRAILSAAHPRAIRELEPILEGCAFLALGEGDGLCHPASSPKSPAPRGVALRL